MASYLAEQVETFIRAETGHAYDILVLATPPQHGKSMTITESLPSWVAGIKPDWRVIQASYNEETAERFCRRNREKIERYGKNLFGIELGLTRATEYELSGHSGRMISRGILSGITGNPAELILIDDPIKNRQEADSATVRGRLWEEWLSSLKSRLAAHGKVILIMTPWHEDDLRARILSTETHCTYIRLPIEAEEKDPLGRKPGEALCPELGKGDAWLQEFKAAYLADPEGGGRAWQALYQCNPRLEGGNLVHRVWWKFYEPDQAPRFGVQLISVDATFKGGEDNDYVAITVWGKSGQDYYLLYCLNRHLDFPGTLDALMTVTKLYPYARTILIEDKANGSAIIQTLQRRLTGVVPVNPQGGKVARVNAVSSAIESGHVYLPQGAPWLEEYLEQWTAFPAGKHDDMVDSSTQALHRLLYANGTPWIPQQTAAEEEDRRLREQGNGMILDGDILYDVYAESFGRTSFGDGAFW